MSDLLYEKKDKIATITLNRPDKLNAISAELQNALLDAFRKADAEYYRAFCALTLYHADGEKLLEDFITSHPLYPKAISAYYDLASFFYAEKN